MTENERVELEVCIDILSSLIGDFYNVASEQNIPLNNNDDIEAYYKNMIKYLHMLRRTTSYEDVLAARKKIVSFRIALSKLEVYHAV